MRELYFLKYPDDEKPSLRGAVVATKTSPDPRFSLALLSIMILILIIFIRL